jgi:hypothetical protein
MTVSKQLTKYKSHLVGGQKVRLGQPERETDN